MALAKCQETEVDSGATWLVTSDKSWSLLRSGFPLHNGAGLSAGCRSQDGVQPSWPGIQAPFTISLGVSQRSSSSRPRGSAIQTLLGALFVPR